MHAEVAGQILLRLALVIAVIAGMENEDVAPSDLHAIGDVLGGDNAPVLDAVGDVDDHPSCTSLVRGREAMSPAPSAACIGPSRCLPTCSEVSTRWETMRFVCSVCDDPHGDVAG